MRRPSHNTLRQLAAAGIGTTTAWARVVSADASSVRVAADLSAVGALRAVWPSAVVYGQSGQREVLVDLAGHAWPMSALDCAAPGPVADFLGRADRRARRFSRRANGAAAQQRRYIARCERAARNLIARAAHFGDWPCPIWPRRCHRCRETARFEARQKRRQEAANRAAGLVQGTGGRWMTPDQREEERISYSRGGRYRGDPERAAARRAELGLMQPWEPAASVDAVSAALDYEDGIAARAAMIALEMGVA